MTYKDFLSSVPGIVAGLVGSSFVLTAIVEWAYHYSIGSRFIYLNSPTDLASLSLLYMPGVGISLFLLAVFCMFVFRLKGHKFWGILGALIIYTIWQMLGFIKSPSSEHSTILFWVFPSCLLWLMLVSWFLRSPLFMDKLTTKRWFVLSGALTFIPLFVGLFFAIGVYQASVDLSFTRGNYRVVYLNDVVEDNVRLLKATSKGILILRLPGKEISFLNYHSFKRIDWTGASVQE